MNGTTTVPCTRTLEVSTVDGYDDLDEGLDPEVEESEPEPPASSVEELGKQLEKARKEAQSLRTRLRRSEMSSEFGNEIVELVPSSLPLKEQRDLAAKLSQRLAPPATTPTTEEVAPPAEPDQGPSPEEVRAAALVRSGGGVSAESVITDPQEAVQIAFRDPAAYERMKKSGLIRLDRLPGAEF